MKQLITILAFTFPLTIFAQTYTQITDTVCGEYSFNGVVYDSSGVYYDTLFSQNGFDSIVILNLSVIQDSSVSYINSCDSVSWNGLWYFNDTVVTTDGLITSNQSGGLSARCKTDVLIMVDMSGSTYGPTSPPWTPGSQPGNVYSAETMFVWEFIQAMSADMIAGHTQVGVMLWSSGGVTQQTPGTNISGNQLWLSNDPYNTGWYTNITNSYQGGMTPMYSAFTSGVNFLNGAVLNDFSGNPRSSLGDRTLDPLYRRVHIFVTDGMDNGNPSVAYSNLGCSQQGSAPSPPGSQATLSGQPTINSRVIGVYASPNGGNPTVFYDLESIACVPSGGYVNSPNIFNVGTNYGVSNPPDIVANTIASTTCTVPPSGCDSSATAIITINSSSSFSSATACNTYTWDGVVYTTSGAYSNVYTNVAGCDSVHTLTLTINNANTGTSSATSCDSYTWDGVIYTTSGIYTNVYTNSVGCDSVHTLNLTINNSNTGSSSVTVCDSYNWDGVIYTTSGVYSNIYTNVAGCDSVHTLTLAINNANTGTSSATACDSYTWDGVIYTTSGVYSNTYTNAAGCDSIHTLSLTINSSNAGISSATACDSYNWDGVIYTTSGVYSNVYTNVAGCDSVHTLTLAINNSNAGTTSATSCDSYTWDGVVYTTSGAYSNVYTNVASCDSVHTLTLTINNTNTGTSLATACDSYTWDGVIYTTSGVYSNTYTNAKRL